MMCARCDKPIDGQPKPVTIDSGTGASSTVYICRTPCRRAPQQTAPTRRPERHRPRRR